MVSFDMHFDFGFDQRRHCKAKWPHQSWIGADNFPAASFAEQVGDGLQEPGLSKKGMEVYHLWECASSLIAMLNPHPTPGIPWWPRNRDSIWLTLRGSKSSWSQYRKMDMCSSKLSARHANALGGERDFFNHPKIRVLGLGFIILNP